MGRLEGKVGIVTGAGRGLGEASALMFAREGAKLVLGSITKANVRAVTRKVTREGGEAVGRTVDVACEADVEDLVYTAVKEFGRLDFLYNCAGVASGRSLFKETEEEWDRILGINLKGPAFGIKHGASAMIETGGGSIINVSSATAFAAHPGQTSYSAAKAGLHGLTRTAAVELAHKGVRVNIIVPGVLDTDMFRKGVEGTGGSPKKYLRSSVPMNRAGRPEEVASLAVFLASDESTYCTGASFAVDGGMMVQGTPLG